MPSCEKCWVDAYRLEQSENLDQPSAYQLLVKTRDASGHTCTPEQQAGPDAGICATCGRRTIHQHVRDWCMACNERRAERSGPLTDDDLTHMQERHDDATSVSLHVNPAHLSLADVPVLIGEVRRLNKEAAPRWTQCADAMPPDGEIVLCFDGDDTVWIGIWRDHEETWDLWLPYHGRDNTPHLYGKNAVQCWQPWPKCPEILVSCPCGFHGPASACNERQSVNPESGDDVTLICPACGRPLSLIGG